MILISVTAVAGIGCIIAAFVMGADPRQIRNYAEGKTSGKLQTEERNIRADQIRKLNIDIGSGDIDLTTITTSKTEIDLGSGDVTLTMAGTEKDYNYNIDCGSGDVKIGDILFEDDLKKRNINALRWINIDCGSGDLTIDFDNTIL